MTSMNITIARTRQKDAVPVTRARSGAIRLLAEVNSCVNRRIKPRRSRQRLCDVFRDMQVGDSVFLEGYTSNHNDRDPSLKYMRTQSYTRGNTIVLTVRSTEENGVKGVRVYREG